MKYRLTVPRNARTAYSLCSMLSFTIFSSHSEISSRTILPDSTLCSELPNIVPFQEPLLPVSGLPWFAYGYYVHNGAKDSTFDIPLCWFLLLPGQWHHLISGLKLYMVWDSRWRFRHSAALRNWSTLITCFPPAPRIRHGCEMRSLCKLVIWPERATWVVVMMSGMST